MALLLFIDTSTRNCSVLLAQNEQVLASKNELDSLSHATLLPNLITEVMKLADKQMADLDGVVVAGGPGSYTGLRIGMSAAKGICYALDLPLIVIDTLESLTDAMRIKTNFEDAYYIATLDSRKGEIYYAIADASGELLIPSTPAIVEEIDWSHLKDKIIYIAGKTNNKIKNIKFALAYEKIEIPYLAENYVKIGFNRFRIKDFDNLVYKEPNYLKPFQ